MLPPTTTFSRPAVAAAVVGVVLTGVLGLLLGPRAAAYWLAFVVGGFAIARSALPPSRIAPFAVRDRWLDTTLMATAAVLLAVATAVAPW